MHAGVPVADRSRGGARGAPPPPFLILDQTKARPEGRGAYTDLPKNHALDLVLTYMLYFNYYVATYMFKVNVQYKVTNNSLKIYHVRTLPWW